MDIYKWNYTYVMILHEMRMLLPSTHEWYTMIHAANLDHRMTCHGKSPHPEKHQADESLLTETEDTCKARFFVPKMVGMVKYRSQIIRNMYVDRIQT